MVFTPLLAKGQVSTTISKLGTPRLGGSAHRSSCSLFWQRDIVTQRHSDLYWARCTLSVRIAGAKSVGTRLNRWSRESERGWLPKVKSGEWKGPDAGQTQIGDAIGAWKDPHTCRTMGDLPRGESNTVVRYCEAGGGEWTGMKKVHRAQNLDFKPHGR